MITAFRLRFRSNVKAYLALGIGVVIIGWSPLFIRWANAPGVVTAFYRVVIAVLVLGVPFLRKRRKSGHMASSTLCLAIISGICFGLDLGLWTTGVTMSGVTTPTLLANTAPVWVGLGAMLLFRERLRIGFWVGLALAMVGAALIIGVDRWSSVVGGTGSTYGLMAGIFYGCFFLSGQKVRENLDTLSFFWIVGAGAACILGVTMLVLRQPLFGYEISTYLNFLYLGVIIQVGGWLAITYALGRLSAATVAPMMLAQPVISAVLAHFLLGERLGLWQSLGGVAVLLGVLLVQFQRIRV